MLVFFVLIFCISHSAQANIKTNQWLSYYKNSSQDDFQTIASFLKANPDWPAQRSLQLHAESKLAETISNDVLLNWFQSFAPITPKAADLYALTLKRSGQGGKAKAFLQLWWEDARFDRGQQKGFYAKYKSYLNQRSHKNRLNTLLYRGDSGNALAIANVLGGGYPALARARLALRAHKTNVNGLIAKIPTNLSGDAGLIYERLRWRRKNDFDDGATALLLKAPDVSMMHDPKAWWLERHILIRRLLEDKKYAKAYKLAAVHKQKEGLPFAQAEWMAGWLSLNFLNKPDRAFQHFNRLYKGVKSPISRARAAYWAGLASKKLGHGDVAQKWLALAARYDTTFYGQMAATSFLNAPRLFNKSKYSNSGGRVSQVYVAKELARAAKYLMRIQKKDAAGLFVAALRNQAKSADDLKNNAIFANDIGLPVLSIRATANALKDFGTLYVDKAYPIRPQDMRQVNDVEWALVHALMRQESRFDQYAVSHAGARGLMQLMPATAKQVARKQGVAHQQSWLTSRPAHNIFLGSRYVRQMLDRYDNNYAMALAAYNAGPGRVDKWIKIYGDPRTSQIDLIDWIEFIPIYETRNYVHRVLEATYIYRGLLNGIQPRANASIHVSYKR